MPKRITHVSRSNHANFGQRSRYEHWLVDNQVYFITARCREQYCAFASAAAKAVFWNRFDHYTNEFGFVPWVTSLLDNHYHTLGYLRIGKNLPLMMQRIHGSVAKLVNDVLPQRVPSFGAMPKAKNTSTAASATNVRLGSPTVTSFGNQCATELPTTIELTRTRALTSNSTPPFAAPTNYVRSSKACPTNVTAIANAPAAKAASPTPDLLAASPLQRAGLRPNTKTTRSEVPTA